MENNSNHKAENNDNIENKKIVLSERVQEDMLKFFLKTSIPRKKKLAFLSKENESGGKKDLCNKTKD
jgi:hypothetical protein